MDQATRQQKREDYLKAALVPLDLFNYSKIIGLIYKERIFKLKYFAIYLLLSSSIFFFARLAIGDYLAFLMVLSSFVFIIIITPPALVFFFYFLAKIGVGPRLRKYGTLKNL